jgi:NAD(P)-dependent dehydrogenase (short-subunit alcohol dehydrogenase family)
MSTGVLSKRVCLITGSSRGIGLGLARVFARHRAIVTLHGRDEKPPQETMAGLLASSETDYISADLGTTAGIEKLVAAFVQQHDRLEVLIHCAGILGAKTELAAYPPEVWEEVLRINLTAPFLLTQGLLPALRNGDRPSVIFVSSGVGRKGRAEWGAYAVSKFGIEGLSQIWADELRQEGIRVNAVNPGGTRTQMRAAAYPYEDPKTLPTPEDIAPVFVWLARADTQISGKSLEARDWIGRDPTV